MKLFMLQAVILLGSSLQPTNGTSAITDHDAERTSSDDDLHFMTPNPNPYEVEYEDGTKSPPITLKSNGGLFGGSHLIWEETVAGFTVTPSSRLGKYVYMDVNNGTGDLVETTMVVGVDNPGQALRKHAAMRGMNMRAARQNRARVGEQGNNSSNNQGNNNSSNNQGNINSSNNQGNNSRRRQQEVSLSIGTLKNLVIPIRFSDHVGRALPSRSDLDILMNNVGPNSSICPTGSVRDVYLQNSFNQLQLESTVLDWVTISSTEAECALNQSGLTTGFHACLVQALDLAVNAGANFGDYDLDDDNIIDGITFFHSSYAAEWGGTDANGVAKEGRIWSHKWGLSVPWSNNGVRVETYHINPALWRTSGSEIGRIGVVAHETGHFLGLPDLYDYGDGSGIGSYGLMANSWGFDGTQRNPPLMSAWGKRDLQWTTPTVVTTSGTYTLRRSCDNNDMILINHKFPSGEYLLIENRQPCGFDASMPQGGLAIFHLDDNANNNRGYPGQSGWPSNGNHYKVALLQADGSYNMEGGNNRGDSSDLFHGGGVNSIGPNGTSAGSSYPNTNAYQNGNIIDTEVTISNISASGQTMTFDVTLGNAPPPPTASPTSFFCNNLSVQVSVTTDSWPSENSWKIETALGGALVNEGGPFSVADSSFNENLCLDESICYTFTMMDSYGDGIIGNGDFSLTVGGVVALSNPGSGWTELDKTFGDCSIAPTPSTPAPTPVPTASPTLAPVQSPVQTQCSAGEIEVLVSVTTDSWPNESSWTIDNSASDTVAGSAGPFDSASSTYSEDLCLDNSMCYTFTMMDSWGDGIVDNGGFSLSVNGSVILTNQVGNWSFLDKTFGDC